MRCPECHTDSLLDSKFGKERFEEAVKGIERILEGVCSDPQFKAILKKMDWE